MKSKIVNNLVGSEYLNGGGFCYLLFFSVYSAVDNNSNNIHRRLEAGGGDNINNSTNTHTPSSQRPTYLALLTITNMTTNLLTTNSRFIKIYMRCVLFAYGYGSES